MKCCLKTKNSCMKTRTKYPLTVLKTLLNFIIFPFITSLMLAFIFSLSPYLLCAFISICNPYSSTKEHPNVA